MGILNTVVSRFQPEAPDRPYECLQCGVHLDVEYYICPTCGSFAIDRRSIAL